MESKRILLAHFACLHDAVTAAGGTASLDLENFQVKVSIRGETRTVYPQFLARNNGKKYYTPVFSNEVQQLIGWRPYAANTAYYFADKMRTKKFVQENGVATPDFSNESNCNLKDVIIKQNVSSFGETIKGPIREASSYQLDEKKQEFFERFTPGWILKIWYWADAPVVFEKQPMPNIVGDGIHTLDELIRIRETKNWVTANREQLRYVLTFYGLSLDTVLPSGQSQLVDFRYGSTLADWFVIEEVRVDGAQNEALVSDLRKIGRLLCDYAPESVANQPVFAVDAILDDTALWFLEANANPYVHPMLYKHMVSSFDSNRTPT